MLPFLFLFFLFSPSESCLKVNYREFEYNRLASFGPQMLDSEKKCNTCSKDIILTDQPGTLINYEEKENSDGCKTANVTCTAASWWNCTLVDIKGAIEPEVNRSIGSLYSGNNYAMSSLKCNDDGQYTTTRGLKPSSVWCDNQWCTPMPTPPSGLKCNTCSMDGIITESAEPYNLISYSEEQQSDGCRSAFVICTVASGWNCTGYNVMRASGSEIRTITRRWDVPSSGDPYAQSTLKCNDDGQYTYSDKIPSSVWCNMQSCTPLPPQQIENKCDACSMDGIITESAEPYNLINYEEKENSDGCKTANVTCSVADGWDCAIVEVMGTFDGQVVYIISDKSSENFASSSLTCRHDGQYNYYGLNPTSVWCNTTSCTPKPTEPSENKCNACTIDGILKEGSEPYNLVNYEEKENSDGCKTANVTCSVAEGWDCAIVEVMRCSETWNTDSRIENSECTHLCFFYISEPIHFTVGQVVYKISDQSSENFASSSLTCSDDGHYTSFGLKLSDVWCNTHTCTPKPTQPSEKKCNTCSMDGIIRDMGVEVIFVNYEEYENSDGCKIANITCSVADGWNCSDLSVKAFSGAAVNDITRQYIQNFAGSFLTCTDDGQYTVLDLSPTLVWCDSPICTPKPA